MRKEWADEIKAIGDDSWELLRTTGLRANASRASIIEALEADQKWQRDHTDTVSKRIDALVAAIEGSDP